MTAGGHILYCVHVVGRAESDELGASLIDAAERCFETYGVAHTSMSHVAAEAEVSRTTLYRRFRRMEDLLQAVFLREFDRFERRVERRLRSLTDPADRLVEVVVAIAENVPQNAGIARLAEGPRTRAEARAFAVGRSALNERVEVMMGEPLDELERQGHLRGDLDRSTLIEWVRRIVLALALVPPPRARTARDRRRYVEAFLIPAVCRERARCPAPLRRRSA